MSDFKFDQVDLRIVQLLQENSKITNLELSKRINLSPAPTLERVKKMEQSDVITSYHATINPASLGLKIQSFVQISLAWSKPNALNNFIEKINQIDEVIDCYIITGDADFLCRVVTKDIASYEKLMFNNIAQIAEVQQFKTMMTLSTVKSSKVLPYKYQ